MKVLLAVDGSDFTQRTLDFVAARAQIFGPATEFTALTAVAPVPNHAARFLQKSTLDTYYQEEADKVLKPVKAFADAKGWNLIARHAVGQAGDVVAALATEGNFDLVVVGTHGHSHLGGVVVGSVTTRIIAGCKVPVLLVR